MGFGSKPKTPPPPPPPPSTPTRADASTFVAGAGQRDPRIGSLISTAPLGLKRKADTNKRSLIGG